jgi:hypothetical protein
MPRRRAPIMSHSPHNLNAEHSVIAVAAPRQQTILSLTTRLYQCSGPTFGLFLLVPPHLCVATLFCSCTVKRTIWRTDQTQKIRGRDPAQPLQSSSPFCCVCAYIYDGRERFPGGNRRQNGPGRTCKHAKSRPRSSKLTHV